MGYERGGKCVTECVTECVTKCVTKCVTLGPECVTIDAVNG
ncbi:hypothetical protein OG963_00130 [Streptomyces sp. NBC_01707]